MAKKTGRSEDTTGPRSDPSLAPVVERLKDKFDTEYGPLDEEAVEEVVQSEADKVADAPVKAFTELITEKKARERLRRMADEATKASEANG